jgi:hypothetical protein
VIFGASGVGVGFVVDPPQAAAHNTAPNTPLRKRMIATLKPILEASVDSIRAGARLQPSNVRRTVPLREEIPLMHSSCVLRVFVTSWLHFCWVG